MANIIEYKDIRLKRIQFEDKVFLVRFDISDTIIFEINNSNEVESVSKMLLMII